MSELGRIGICGVKGWIGLSSLALAVALAGCAVGPEYFTPDTARSRQLHQSASGQGGGLRRREPGHVWWRSLLDPVLNELIARALEKNAATLI
jgi:multidrug efflux system outer membrane protein